MKTAIPVRRRDRQRGSALLIVLVFSAIAAIMLYRELPIAAFEAQRQKEELLVTRGNEYKRGVQLFVRKVGRFPSTIAELENTNRMRFLRHRYVDPLTGKDDWRLIHAGPGGVIVDSKVASKNVDPKNSNALGQGAVFAGFNNSFSGDPGAAPETAPAGVRQRAPATKNAATVTPDSAANPPGFAVEPINADPNDPNAPNPQPVSNPPGPPGQIGGYDPATGQLYPNSQTQANGGQVPAPGQPAAVPTPGVGNPGIGSVAQQLNNVNQRTPEQAQQQQTSAFGNSQNPLGGGAINGLPGNGQIGAAGGIAGVASIAKGTSIKTVNDQTKYSLWEFYYDLRKEQSGAAAAGQQNALPTGVNGNPSGNTNSGSAFGSSGSSFGGNSASAFGQTQSQGQQQSAFGVTSSQQTQPQTQAPPP